MNLPPTLPTTLSSTRLLRWSVRRELWEHPMLFGAPAATAAVILLATLYGLFNIVPIQSVIAHVSPLSSVSLPIIWITFWVGAYYSLGALYGERRDRTILFWKSLPVSDRTSVLAKAAIPLVVLPLIAFTVIVATHVILLLSETTILGIAATLEQLNQLPRIILITLYILIVSALWQAPVYAWLLLVSGWARRAPFIWAVLPVMVLIIVEFAALHDATLASLVSHRFTIPYAEAFSSQAHAEGPSFFSLTIGPKTPNTVSLSDMVNSADPIKFLGTPDLWIGLAVAAGFLAAAIWLRRRSEPI